MAKTLDQVGIETGNTVEAYHVTQSIDAFTGVEAYDISLSGSFNTTGSLNVTGSVTINGLSDTSQTNVLTIDTTTGQLFYTASTSVSPIDTGSFVTTASVNLNTITFTQGDGSTFPITVDTGSGGGGGGITPADTGSFYISSSVNLNTITFNQGDGTTESVTVDTGSGGSTFNYSYVETQDYTFPVHPDNSSYTLQTKDARFSLDDPAGNSTFFLPDFVTEIGQVIEIFYFGLGAGTLQISASAVGTGATIFLHRGVGGSSTAGGTVTTNNSGEACYFKLMATSGSLGGGIGLSGTLVSDWRISNYWDDTLITTIDIVVTDQLTLA